MPSFGMCRQLVCAVIRCMTSFGVCGHSVINGMTPPQPKKKKKKRKKKKRRKKQTRKRPYLKVMFYRTTLTLRSVRALQAFHFHRTPSINASFCSHSTSKRFVLFALHKQTFRSVLTPQAFRFGLNKQTNKNSKENVLAHKISAYR